MFKRYLAILTLLVSLGFSIAAKTVHSFTKTAKSGNCLIAKKQPLNPVLVPNKNAAIKSAKPLIIFDLHGVLIQHNSAQIAKDLAKTWWKASKKFKLLCTLGSVMQEILSDKIRKPKISRGESDKYVEGLIARHPHLKNYKNDIKRIFNYHHKIVPGMKELIAELIQQNIVDIAVASNIGQDSYNYSAELPKLKPVLDTKNYILVFTSDNAPSAKPADSFFEAFKTTLSGYYAKNKLAEPVIKIFIDDKSKNVNRQVWQQ